MKDDLVERCARAVDRARRSLASDAEIARDVLAIARSAILEEAAQVADKYPERDPAEDGNGYWAAGEIAAAIRALAHTTGQEGGR